MVCKSYRALDFRRIKWIDLFHSFWFICFLIGVNGLQELQGIDPRFQEFDALLFWRGLQAAGALHPDPRGQRQAGQEDQTVPADRLPVLPAETCTEGHRVACAQVGRDFNEITGLEIEFKQMSHIALQQSYADWGEQIREDKELVLLRTVRLQDTAIL